MRVGPPGSAAAQPHSDVSRADVPPARVADAVDRVRALLRGIPRLGVAFSGGVDSSVLLALAMAELGPDHVVALLGVSPSLAESERVWAHEVADVLGAPLVEVTTREAQRPAYVANAADRCYHCKSELFTRIEDEVVERLGLTSLAYGENADDAARADRPGSVAAVEHAVRAPLAEAGLTKADVRAVAWLLAVPGADKPAAPCLASRIPHQTPVSPEALREIEVAEAALHDLGFRECRVRHHGELARVELPLADLPRVRDPRLHRRLVTRLRAAGFREVLVDPAGLQSGAFTLAALDRERG